MMEQQKINFAISFAAAATLLLASAAKITAEEATSYCIYNTFLQLRCNAEQYQLAFPKNTVDH